MKGSVVVQLLVVYGCVLLPAVGDLGGSGVLFLFVVRCHRYIVVV